MVITSIILQSLLVAYYLFSGFSKMTGAKYWVNIFEEIKLPQWFRVVTGGIQFIGAAILITGYWYESAVVYGAILLGITMIGAVLAHIRVRDTFNKTAAAIVFLVLIVIFVGINAGSIIQPLT